MTTAETPHQEKPIVFEEFFDLGLQETVSPFLTPEARLWSANLTLKSAIAAAFLLIITFVLSFFPTTLSLSHFLLIVIYFLAGIPSLIEAIEDLSAFEINIDVLMTLAAFSSVLIGSGMEGALLLVLFALSGAMEDAVTAKAKGAISSLHKLSPTKASVVEPDGRLIERSVKDIKVGTQILVKAGEVIPLDGEVIGGASSVNLVHLTGENLPVSKLIGDTVPAGGRNMEGSLTLTVTSTSAESTLSRIIQLVIQAQEARPALQRWFDKLSRGYAIAIILLALLFALTLPIFLGIPILGVEGSLYRAIAFLIAASPCALIIAIPIAYLSAVSICAKRGILLKGGITLDALARCHTVAFDKTGTLTLGNLLFEGMVRIGKGSSDSLTEQQALSIAYALEKNAVHPIAKAILDYYSRHQPQTAIHLENFKSVPGHGLEAIALLPQGKVPVYIGNPDYIAAKLPPEFSGNLDIKIQEIQNRGELVAVLLVGSEIFLFRFRDALRPAMNETINALKARGYKTVMLTGDHQSNAKKIADELGIEDYYAELKPEDKLHHVTELAQKGGLAMVGDGVNDAPALARATVGICMGKVGSTTAIEAADVVLLHDNIELLDWLISKAHQTRAIVKQNVILATGAIIFASIPALAGWVPLWLAVVMHEGGTVLVGLNALRLLKK